jgi:hypothetical protein
LSRTRVGSRPRMEYVIPAVILLLLIGGFVTFLVLNATRKSGPVADRGDEGAPGIGRDPTPLGDTTEHAGEQSRQGYTRDDPESGRPRDGDDGDAARQGEGEGERRLARDDEDPRPASERLADREF